MDFKTRFARLVDVKSIVTFVVTAVFAYLAVTSKIAVDQFMIIAVMVFTYFFSKKPEEPADTRVETKTTETKTSGGEG